MEMEIPSPVVTQKKRGRKPKNVEHSTEPKRKKKRDEENAIEIEPHYEFQTIQSIMLFICFLFHMKKENKDENVHPISVYLRYMRRQMNKVDKSYFEIFFVSMKNVMPTNLIYDYAEVGHLPRERQPYLPKLFSVFRHPCTVIDRSYEHQRFVEIGDLITMPAGKGDEPIISVVTKTGKNMIDVKESTPSGWYKKDDDGNEVKGSKITKGVVYILNNH